MKEKHSFPAWCRCGNRMQKAGAGLSASLILCFTLISCAVQQHDNNDEAAVFNFPMQQKQLDNKLNIVSVEYPSPDIAAFYIVVRAGSREEVEPGKTGFAHFFEHMMFRGTEKYPNDKYNEVLKGTGAAANANTWLDRTVYHMTGSAAALETMFELESDRFMNLQYAVHDFKTEAGAVKGEYTKAFANPYRKLNERIVSTAFTEHTYKHTTMGFIEDIIDMPNQYDYSLTFFDRFYRPEYTTIVVVGDVKPEKVFELSEKYFGKWQTGQYKPEIPIEPEQTETRYTHVQQEGFPPYLSMNFKGPEFSDSSIDNAALNIIGTMLFSQRSDIYKKLVLEEGLARSLNHSFFYTRDPYLFSVNASLKDAKDLAYVKEQIWEVLNDLKYNPVDEDLLEATKEHIINSFSMGLDSPTAIAEALSYFIWVSGTPESINNYFALYEDVNQEAIMEIAKKYFNPGQLTIGTIASSNENPLK